MNSNWFKLIMKMTKAEYGKNLLLKGVPIIFNKGGAKLKIGENVTIKSSFLSNLVGLYSRTIIVTRAPGAEIEIGDTRCWTCCHQLLPAHTFHETGAAWV